MQVECCPRPLAEATGNSWQPQSIQIARCPGKDHFHPKGESALTVSKTTWAGRVFERIRIWGTDYMRGAVGMLLHSPHNPCD